VNPNFGKTNLYVPHCVASYCTNCDICEISWSIGLVVFLCAGTVWTCSTNFTERTLHLRFVFYSFTRTRFITFTLFYVNPEVPVCKTWKFQFVKLGSFEFTYCSAQIQKFQICKTGSSCDSSSICKLGTSFVSVMYMLVSVKLVCVYVKLLKT
jgi:hypothetical protein